MGFTIYIAQLISSFLVIFVNVEMNVHRFPLIILFCGHLLLQRYQLHCAHYDRLELVKPKQRIDHSFHMKEMNIKEMNSVFVD